MKETPLEGVEIRSSGMEHTFPAEQQTPRRVAMTEDPMILSKEAKIEAALMAWGNDSTQQLSKTKGDRTSVTLSNRNSVRMTPATTDMRASVQSEAFLEVKSRVDHVRYYCSSLLDRLAVAQTGAKALQREQEHPTYFFSDTTRHINVKMQSLYNERAHRQLFHALHYVHNCFRITEDFACQRRRGEVSSDLCFVNSNS